MIEQAKLETALETLGHMAAQCELYASDKTLSDSERLDQLIRANAYREEQQALLLRSEQTVSCQVAAAIVREMLATRSEVLALIGAGYDMQGNWHAPKPSNAELELVALAPEPAAIDIADLPDKPNPWKDVRPLSADHAAKRPASSWISYAVVWTWITLAGIVGALCLILLSPNR